MKLALILCAFLISLFGTRYFREVALRKGIISQPNFRSLHHQPVARGAGLVIALSFVFSLSVGTYYGLVSPILTLPLIIGGICAAVFGFIDDRHDLSAGLKLAIQITFAGITVFVFLSDVIMSSAALLALVSLLFLVSLINAYNFIDGIDGLAVTTAIFISMAAACVIFITNGDEKLITVFVLVAAGCLGFLFFNWPPATVFMGDSGSVFLGYILGVLVIYSVLANDINAWTWVIIFSYVLGDTITTTLSRIFLVKRWYGAHRSHAYQNLARILNSHKKVLLGVTLYHLLWALPLAIWSALAPSAGKFAAILAFAPVVLWTLRYGPRLSSD